ncbi:MAG: hypothetical protein ACE5H2_07610, partial [Terriglobia bacterium]
MLDVKLIFEPTEAISTPALVTWVYEKEAPLDDVLAQLNQATAGQPATAGQLQALLDSGELTGKA